MGGCGGGGNLFRGTVAEMRGCDVEGRMVVSDIFLVVACEDSLYFVSIFLVLARFQ